jgi:deoxyadenosine/deoxycytidine kinase
MAAHSAGAHCGDVTDVVVVSGASGAGKSTLAALLAQALGQLPEP